MYNLYDNEDEHDYGPNELAELSSKYKEKRDQIINSNLQEGDTIERWQRRNLEMAKESIACQRSQ